MANDPPTTLKMGFGYSEARAAGLGGIRAARSPKQVNRIIKENKRERDATKALADELRSDSDWKPFVEWRLSEGCTLAEIWGEIYWTKTYLRMRARGYSIAGCLKHFWPYSN